MTPRIPLDPAALAEADCGPAGRFFAEIDTFRALPSLLMPDLTRLRREVDALAWLLLGRLAAEWAVSHTIAQEIPLDSKGHRS